MTRGGSDAAAVIVFDGVCNLCSGVVRFVAARDPRGRFRFAARQSAAGQALLARHGLSPAAAEESVLLLAGGRVYARSDAVLRIAAGLSGPWPLLALLRIVPRPLRDAVYAWVARNRYGWFGRRRTCLVPTGALRARFVDVHDAR